MFLPTMMCFHKFYFFDTSQQAREAGIMISPILQMGKWEVKKISWLVQDHTISKLKRQISVWGLSTPTYEFFLLHCLHFSYPEVVQPAFPNTLETQDFSTQSCGNFRDRVLKNISL